jgi:hypothetical protein
VSGDHRGASIRRPDEDLPPPPEPSNDAHITEEDIRRAAARWQELAPPAMRHLLDAEPVGDDEPPPSAKI